MIGAYRLASDFRPFRPRPDKSVTTGDTIVANPHSERGSVDRVRTAGLRHKLPSSQESGEKWSNRRRAPRGGRPKFPHSRNTADIPDERQNARRANAFSEPVFGRVA
jgi:hypothetical protein